LDGARKRRDAAAEAERQAELEAVGSEAKAHNDQLTAELAAFDKKAAALADHAANITRLRHELGMLNQKLVAGDRSDLRQIDPIKQRARAEGRLIIDPLTNLQIQNHWPRRASIAAWSRASAQASAQ
jgi:hypothetical protein